MPRARLEIIDQVLYLGKYGRLVMLDLSDPSGPRQLDKMEFSSGGEVFAAEGNLLAVATGPDAIALYRNALGTHPGIVDQILGRKPVQLISDLNGDGAVDAGDLIRDRIGPTP